MRHATKLVVICTASLTAFGCAIEDDSDVIAPATAKRCDTVVMPWRVKLEVYGMPSRATSTRASTRHACAGKLVGTLITADADVCWLWGRWVCRAHRGRLPQTVAPRSL